MLTKGRRQLSLILLLRNDQPLEEAILLLKTLQNNFGIACALAELEEGMPARSQIDFIVRHRVAAEEQGHQLLRTRVEDEVPWHAEANQQIERALGCNPASILLRRGNKEDLRKAITKILLLARHD